MNEQTSYLEERFEPEPLSRGEYLIQVLNGVGVGVGLAVLWLMEVVRDMVFHMLDRLNLKPRKRSRASAFPPGRPRKRPPMPIPAQEGSSN